MSVISYIFTIIFYLINNKKIEIGNNDNNQILNMIYMQVQNY